MNTRSNMLPLERIGEPTADVEQGPAPTPGESVPHPEVGTPHVSQAASRITRHWDLIQAKFVDDPRQSVAEAHQLVRHLTEQLMDALGNERAGIERRWSGAQGISTEDLRLCLQQYRSIFGRLLWATPQSPGCQSAGGGSNGVEPEGDTLEDSARA
jgi:hypothetical protein